MTPSSGDALRSLMMTLMAEIAPHVGDEYVRSNVQLIGVLQMLLAEECDRTAAVRAWENSEMRALFARGLLLLADPELAAELRNAAEGRDDDLHVHALNRSNAELKRLFIRFQIALEAIDAGEEPAALRAELWRFLVEAAERRKFNLG